MRPISPAGRVDARALVGTRCLTFFTSFANASRVRMKCFRHHDRDAIGMCKACQRGLCPECAVEFPQGLACRGHEDDVQNLIRLIQNNVRLSPTSLSLVGASRRSGVIAAAFYLVTGLIFALWGMRDGMSFSIALGGALVIYGLVSLVRTLRITAPK